MTTSTGPQPPHHDQTARVANVLRTVALKLARYLRREALNAGFSTLDSFILGHLWRRPGLGVSELADLEHMSRPSMCAHVKRLEAAGWVAKEAAVEGDDKRRARLVLTGEGELTLGHIRRIRTQWLETRLVRLTREEILAIGDALEPFLRVLETED